MALDSPGALIWFLLEAKFEHGVLMLKTNQCLKKSAKETTSSFGPRFQKTPTYLISCLALGGSAKPVK
jgi:hypothetical protein